MKSRKETNNNLTRRDFLKRASASAIGVSLLGSYPFNSSASYKNLISPKSKVVLIRSSKVINSEGTVNRLLLKEMLNIAITQFSGKKNATEFWKTNFSLNETIGLKVNTLGLNSISGSPLIDHFNALTTVILDSFSTSDFKMENFITWDRSEEELVSAGFTIQKENGKPKVIANVESRRGSGGIGYSEEEFPVGEKSTHISKILTEMCSSLINIPVMKDHGTAGFTGALKNHYGSINNARDFHSNNCTNPGIPEINLIPVIRNKQKLIIADALLGVFNGGPRWDRNNMFTYGGILVSTDPVAIDRIMLNIINERRKIEGLSEISNNFAKHITIAKELGLGTDNLNEIDFKEINFDLS